MSLPRELVVSGILAEHDAFADLIRSLDERAWAAPSRCAGWTAADVAAHVVGTLSDVVAGKVEGLGSPETAARQVDERRRRSQHEVADELEQARKVATDILQSFDDAAWNGPAPGGFPGTLGWGVETLWYDAYVHADDIRVAAGLPSVRGDGIRVGLHHVAQALEDQGWGPATLALDGVEEIPVGGGDGGGRRVTGDPFQFLLTATGRGDPAQFGLDDTVNIYR